MREHLIRARVIYESRLELARLLFADLDLSVGGIVAQPFLLKTVLEGKFRRDVRFLARYPRDWAPRPRQLPGAWRPRSTVRAGRRA
ncbi:hypothetical protein AB0I54_44095, partial [Streptomyces sp. NPDC050625]